MQWRRLTDSHSKRFNPRLGCKVMKMANERPRSGQNASPRWHIVNPEKSDVGFVRSKALRRFDGVEPIAAPKRLKMHNFCG